MFIFYNLKRDHILHKVFVIFKTNPLYPISPFRRVPQSAPVQYFLQPHNGRLPTWSRTSVTLPSPSALVEWLYLSRPRNALLFCPSPGAHLPGRTSTWGLFTSSPSVCSLQSFRQVTRAFARILKGGKKKIRSLREIVTILLITLEIKSIRFVIHRDLVIGVD